MSLPVLRPRSPTEIVDGAFQLFRQAPTPFLLAAAWVYVPWLVIRAVLGVGMSGGLPTTSDTIIAGIGALVVYALVSGAVSILARAAYLGEPLDVRDAFAQTFARLVSLLVAGLLRAILVGIGLVLLFVPGFYLLARFFAITQAIVLEHAPVERAFARSGELSVDLKRHILNTLILVWLLIIVVNVGFAFVGGLAGSQVVLAVVTTAAAILAYPFLGIAETLLYYDARIRREGFDVEYLANQAGPVGPVAAAAPAPDGAPSQP